MSSPFASSRAGKGCPRLFAKIVYGASCPVGLLRLRVCLSMKRVEACGDETHQEPVPETGQPPNRKWCCDDEAEADKKCLITPHSRDLDLFLFISFDSPHGPAVRVPSVRTEERDNAANKQFRPRVERHGRSNNDLQSLREVDRLDELEALLRIPSRHCKYAVEEIERCNHQCELAQCGPRREVEN